MQGCSTHARRKGYTWRWSYESVQKSSYGSFHCPSTSDTNKNIVVLRSTLMLDTQKASKSIANSNGATLRDSVANTVQKNSFHCESATEQSWTFPSFSTRSALAQRALQNYWVQSSDKKNHKLRDDVAQTLQTCEHTSRGMQTSCRATPCMLGIERFVHPTMDEFEKYLLYLE